MSHKKSIVKNILMLFLKTSNVLMFGKGPHILREAGTENPHLSVLSARARGKGTVVNLQVCKARDHRAFDRCSGSE
jgi:hypothetical protein